MSVRIDIENALVGWLAGAGLTRVIIADPNAPRPPKPYCSVKVRVYDVPTGGDALFYGDGLEVVAHGPRRAAATVEAFGSTAMDELEAALAALPLPTAQEYLIAAGLTVEPEGGLRDITALVDTSREPRAILDLDLAYERSSATETFVEADTVAVDQEVDDLSTSYEVSI